MTYQTHISLLCRLQQNRPHSPCSGSCDGHGTGEPCGLPCSCTCHHPPEEHGWTHPLCTVCWQAEHPDGRQPHRIIEADYERCCRCGTLTGSGIYIRRAALDLPYCSDHA